MKGKGAAAAALPLTATLGLQIYEIPYIIPGISAAIQPNGAGLERKIMDYRPGFISAPVFSGYLPCAFGVRLRYGWRESGDKHLFVTSRCRR